jgi:hypothetical protein
VPGLQEHVGPLEEPFDHARGFGRFEIESERLLRSIQPHEVTRHPFDRGVVPAREVAAIRSLDLDHARAEVGKLPCRKRRGHGLLDRDDACAL